MSQNAELDGDELVPSEVVLQFRQAFGGNALLLACHASVMHRIRPDVIALIRSNFLNGNARLDPSLDAVLLYRGLCIDQGGGFFAMREQVRHHLVRMLDILYPKNSQGRFRSQIVARFVRTHAQRIQHIDTSSQYPRYQRYLHENIWRALALDDPDAAARKIYEHLKWREEQAPEDSAPPPSGAGIEAVVGPVLATLDREISYATALDLIAHEDTSVEGARLIQALGAGPLTFAGGGHVDPSRHLANVQAVRQRRSNLLTENLQQNHHSANKGDTHGDDTQSKLRFDPDKVITRDTDLHKAVSSASIEQVNEALKQSMADIDELDSGGLGALHLAIKLGHQEIARLLIQSGATVDLPSAVGATPLFGACCYGAIDTGLLLLAKGADPTIVNAGGSTPLMAALFYGITELSTALLEHPLVDETHINTTDHAGRNALTWTLYRGSSHWLDILMARGARLMHKTAGDASVLHHATWSKNPGIIARMIKLGCKIDATDVQGWTSLHICAQIGATEVATLLIECGADVNRPHLGGWTALQLAVHWGWRELVVVLLRSGADNRWRTDDGRSLMHIAAAAGKTKLVEYLLQQRGIDVEAVTHSGETVLETAAISGKLKLLDSLLSSLRCSAHQISRLISYAIDQGAHKVLALVLQKVSELPDPQKDKPAWVWQLIDSKESETLSPILTNFLSRREIPLFDGKQPVLAAVANKGNADQVSIVLERRSNEAKTLDDAELFAALRVTSSVDVCTLLLSAGANPDFKEDIFALPLIFNINSSNEMLSLLLKHGADVHARNEQQHSVLHHYALRRDFFEKEEHLERLRKNIRLLISANLDVDSVDVLQQTALHLACANNNIKMLKLLLRQGANANSLRVDGCTPLMLAAQNGHEKAVRIMLKHGAEPYVNKDDGRIAAHLAVSGDHLKVVNLLFSKNCLEPEMMTWPPRTLVQAAAEADAHQVLEKLIAMGQSVDFAYLGSAAPIILAIRNGSYSAAKVLLEHNANTQIHDPLSGLSLQEIARGRQRLHIANIVQTGHPFINPVDAEHSEILTLDVDHKPPPADDQDVLSTLVQEGQAARSFSDNVRPSQTSTTDQSKPSSAAAEEPLFSFIKPGRGSPSSDEGAPDSPVAESTDSSAQARTPTIANMGILLAPVDGVKFSGAANGWIYADKTLYERAVSEIRNMDNSLIMKGNSEVAVREVPFYGNAKMVRFSLPDWQSRNLALYFLATEDSIYHLNGTPASLQEANRRFGARVDISNVESYVRYFFYFSRGRFGLFYLAESLQDRNLSVLKQEDRDTLADLVEPLQLVGVENGSFTSSATIFFKDAVFRCDITVWPDGRYEMDKNSEMLVEGLEPLNLPVTIGPSIAT